MSHRAYTKSCFSWCVLEHEDVSISSNTLSSYGMRSAFIFGVSLITWGGVEHRLKMQTANGVETQCWTADSIHAPDLQEIKTHRIAKESGQLYGLGISDDGRSATARLLLSFRRVIR